MPTDPKMSILTEWFGRERCLSYSDEGFLAGNAHEVAVHRTYRRNTPVASEQPVAAGRPGPDLNSLRAVGLCDITVPAFAPAWDPLGGF